VRGIKSSVTPSTVTMKLMLAQQAQEESYIIIFIFVVNHMASQNHKYARMRNLLHTELQVYIYASNVLFVCIGIYY